MMENIYYSPSTGYTGAEPLVKRSKQPSKAVMQWLESQRTYTLHKPAKRHYIRNKVLVSRIDEQWQADLADLSSLHKYNNGHKYLLNCIDLFSKYAWSIPVKSKSADSVTQAFDSVLKSSGRKPEKLQTDLGTEFTSRQFQKLLKDNDIEFFTTASELKASVIERFNRTLKEKMWRYFTKNNTFKYIDVLQEFISGYNNSVHRTIGIEPARVNALNQIDVLQRAYAIDNSDVIFKFNVGDKVRISKVKGLFEKGYIPNWSEEVFVIHKRLGRTPPVYVLADQLGETLRGIFYEPELAKVSIVDDVYIIEKILRKRKKGNKTEYLVKWKGYSDKFNSWVTDLIKVI